MKRQTGVSKLKCYISLGFEETLHSTCLNVGLNQTVTLAGVIAGLEAGYKHQPLFKPVRIDAATDTCNVVKWLMLVSLPLP